MSESGYGVIAVQNRADSIVRQFHRIDDPPCLLRPWDYVETLAGVAYHNMDIDIRGQMPKVNSKAFQHRERLTEGRPATQTGQDQKYLHESNKLSVARIDADDRDGIALSKMRVKFFQEKFRGILTIAF